MDYSLLNIFLKEKFELGSTNRNRTFRFIRYNGSNYAEIETYLHETSPNTKIWPEKKLVRGKLYHYNGRDFSMNYADELSFRAAIVNNPYLISEKREWIPLKLTKKEATEYLTQSSSHSVFYAKDPLATFKKEINEDKIYEYSSKHPKGLAYVELPNSDFFYICDKTYISTEYYIFNYNETKQELIIDVDFSGFVDKIERLKFSINQTYQTTNQKCLFEPRWDYWESIKVLSKKCMNGSHMNNIISIIYSSVFPEHTKNKHLTEFLSKSGLLKHCFLETLTNFRKHHFNSNTSLINNNIANYVMKCTGTLEPPSCPNDFMEIQKQLYEDLIDFLEKIDNLILKPQIGIIKEDENGTLYHKDIQIANEYSIYKGLKCEFKRYIKNTNNNNKYKYYCKTLDFIYLEIEDEVKIDENKKLYVGNYELPNFCDIEPCTRIQILKIKPIKASKYQALITDYKKIEKKESDFLKYLLVENNREDFLEFLHKQIDISKNLDAVRFLVAGIKLGYINKPSFPDFEKEFPGRVNSKQTFRIDDLLKSAEWDTKIEKYTEYYNRFTDKND